MAAFLVVAAVVPLGIGSWIDIRDAREQRLKAVAALLEARGDEIARRLDTFNDGRLRSVAFLAQQAPVIDYCASTVERPDQRQRALASFTTWPFDDPTTYAMAIVGSDGRVRLGTAPELADVDLAAPLGLNEASRRAATISDLHLVRTTAGSVPAIAFIAPVRAAAGHPASCFIVRWLRAGALWNELKAANGEAGPGSFAVLVDQYGIRIGHTFADRLVFHPTAPLPAAVAADIVARARFGEHTRELLEAVVPSERLSELARAAAPDRAMFIGLSPFDHEPTFAVARRFETVPWTVFYLVPDAEIRTQIRLATWRRVRLGGAFIVAALLAGILLGEPVVRAIRALSDATRKLARGDLAARAPAGRDDELGRLGESFNAMADNIQRQTTQLVEANAELEAFSRSVAHDLRTPLNAVIGFSELLLLECAAANPGERAREYAKKIRDAGHRMNALIEDLLKLSRVSRCEMQHGRVDLGALAGEVVQGLRQASPGRAVEVEIAPGLVTQGDAGLLRILLDNLIGNAWKYTARRALAHIRFAAEPGAGGVVYALRDDTARGSTRRAPAACSSRSSACTARRSSPARASAYPSCGASCSGTAAASGPRPPSTRAPCSASRCTSRRASEPAPSYSPPTSPLRIA